MGIGDYLKPKPKDPLEKTTEYGWGWFVLLGYIGSGLQKIKILPGSTDILLTFVCLPPILVIYFLFRKTFVEKKRFGSEIWTNSFMAGVFATIAGLAIIFLAAMLFIVTGIKID
jgi:hypothetical protein